jgi:3-dehydroquinate dehydratase-2
MKILIINGVNVNFIGKREPEIYGKQSYDDLLEYLNNVAKTIDISVDVFHSNYEGAIVDKLQESYTLDYEGIIINPGAFTHYSYAILDAILSCKIPVVEVHLTDITKREEFRKVSVIRVGCKNSFYGKHFESYKEALIYLRGYIDKS